MLVPLERAKLLSRSHCGSVLANILLNRDGGGAAVGTPSVSRKLGLFCGATSRNVLTWVKKKIKILIICVVSRKFDVLLQLLTSRFSAPHIFSSASLSARLLYTQSFRFETPTRSLDFTVCPPLIAAFFISSIFQINRPQKKRQP